MATVVEATEIQPEDLLRITDRPMPELVKGELVERETSQKPDAITANVLLEVGLFVRQNNLGTMNGSQGSYQIFPDDPRKVRVPDVSFTRKERLPEGPADGHGRVAPDLAVEVTSPHDLADDLNARVVDFLAAGVPLVWVFYPETHTVQIYRADGTFRFLRGEDPLDGEDVLPGFHCPISRFVAV